jgi:glycine/sarcosine N-methyltransferase
MAKEDNEQQAVKSIEEFYDLLAPNYDAMTGFEKRFATERPFFQAMIDRFAFRNALDAGCGSGFHSILLSMLGVDVLGIDASSEMLRVANDNARSHGIRMHTLQCSFDNIDSVVKERFASVFVMGNSLAHLLTPADLEHALRNFEKVMTPNGVLVIQVLNYDRIVARHEHIQSEKQAGSKTFVRSYDYHDETIDFNILTRDQQNSETTQTIRLRPVLRSELVGLLKKAGFDDITLYGGISQLPFDEANSKDLLVLATRKG